VSDDGYMNSFVSGQAKAVGVVYVVGWSKEGHTEVVSAWTDEQSALDESLRMGASELGEELGAAWFVVTMPVCEVKAT
jgi:hypothetical protein